MGHTQMIGVASSQIYAIGYDADTKKLRIQFTKSRGEKAPGSLYEYSNVPKETYDAFLAAESKGRFFGEHIKPAKDKFPYTKIAL